MLLSSKPSSLERTRADSHSAGEERAGAAPRARGTSGPALAASASVVILGPALHAVSGVSTHVNQLLGSQLASQFRFLHFQVGSEGRAAASKLSQAWRFLFDPLRFGAFVVRQRAGIVHINTSMQARGYWRDVLYLAVSRVLGRKVVYQNHGGPLPEAFFPGKALQALFRVVLRSADVVVLLAQIEWRAYRAFVPDVHLEVVPNGLEPKALTRDPISAKAAGPLQLAYLGRLVFDKGLFEALDAMALLKQQGRELRLTIAGSGPDEAKLKSHVQQLGVGDCVQFVGTIRGETKDDLWRASHVFLFPTWHEGLPYALLEAMAAGAVPITTRVGAIPDVMNDGVHGLLVPMKDASALARAIARLDDDRPALSAMAERGRQRILDNYSVARLAGDFQRIYGALAAKP